MKIIDKMEEKMKQAFAEAGYDAEYAKITVSNRPDLCQYQCNGAMAAAKQYKKPPFMIADEVVAKLAEDEMFAKVEMVKPGFINLNLSDEVLADFFRNMTKENKFGYERKDEPKKIVIDYGGPNVAKPLHVGHLRSAIIGESLKRIGRYVGDQVVGDVHLGDWGLQMGLIITELQERKPELVYFDDNFAGEYPEEAPFTISELEEIYPAASAKSKKDEEYLKRAHQATFDIQNKKPGYYALWKHIISVSVADLKKNYQKLNVDFDLWNGESDAQPFIPDMVQSMKDGGFAHISEGALVVDVKEETDTKEVPPCMILKSDGATLYNTTDLATMVQRRKETDPDEIIYVVDKRQELYFTQVFRCAKKTGILKEETKLTFLGFGTMNGKDNKPFKTREGGVMRLENLINQINDSVYEKIIENQEKNPGRDQMTEEEARANAGLIGMAALKYGDLSNQASKDYIFDMARFTSFDGNTGPYILYTIVRIKSILRRTAKEKKAAKLLAPRSDSERDLMLSAVRFPDMLEGAYTDHAPHRICQYIYELSDAFNKFYHENKIATEEDQERKQSWLLLIERIQQQLDVCIGLLGMEAPERM